MQTNLPAQLTSFVGREREIAQLQQLLESVRLLTLVGAGGIGKTRLAVRLASEVAPELADGVWLVELAALQDPALVPQAVAAALDVRERPGEPLRVTLSEALRGQEALLVLDNCEHLVSACAELVEYLLPACGRLRVLATGRQPLGVAGETTWRVPPLATPSAGTDVGADEIGASEAVRLFLERARSHVPGLALTDRNATTVANVCQQLDGIPLALELAAARVSALGLEQILARLGDRFRFLGDAAGRGDPRHRTLRATVEWSHDLLSESERVLFRRLSVFAGGWTLEAAEVVCAGDGFPAEAVLANLEGLARQSLVLVEGHEAVARYGLLETLRQYGAEQLEVAGEAARVRNRHLDCYLTVAERASVGLNGPRQSEFLTVLASEHDNIRVALRWCLESGAIDKALALASECGYFWQIRGHRHRSEARRWLEDALAASLTTDQTAVRARALYWAGTFAAEQFDFPRANTLFEASLDVWQALGNKRGLAEALLGVSLVASDAGEYARAEELLSRSLGICREMGDTLKTARVLRYLGAVARARGHSERAAELTRESLELLQVLGEHHLAGHVLDQLGEAMRDQGELDRAAEAHQRGAELLTGAGCEEGVNTSRYRQARLAALRGDGATAHSIAIEALVRYRVLGFRREVPACLDLIGELIAREQPERAARLMGAAEVMRESMWVRMPPADQANHAAGVASLRGLLGENAFTRAWAAGRAAPHEEAVQLAIGSRDAVEARSAAPSGPLSAREVEVVGLVGRGLSNKEIAATLVVSVRTAEAHITNALNKLGLRSRAQLAVWAADHGLLAART